MLRPLTVRFIYPFVPLCGGTGSPYCEPSEKCGCEEYEAERNVKITRINRNTAMEMEYIPTKQEETSERVWLIVVLAIGIPFLLMTVGSLIIQLSHYPWLNQ